MSEEARQTTSPDEVMSEYWERFPGPVHNVSGNYT